MSKAGITPKQVAEELDVNVQTVRRWLREHPLPETHRLPGGQYRLPCNAAQLLLRPSCGDTATTDAADD